MTNMKKKFLCIAAILCMAFAVPVYAESDGEQVDLQVSIWKPTTAYGKQGAVSSLGARR